MEGKRTRGCHLSSGSCDHGKGIDPRTCTYDRSSTSLFSSSSSSSPLPSSSVCGKGKQITTSVSTKFATSPLSFPPLCQNLVPCILVLLLDIRVSVATLPALPRCSGMLREEANPDIHAVPQKWRADSNPDKRKLFHRNCEDKWEGEGGKGLPAM